MTCRGGAEAERAELDRSHDREAVLHGLRQPARFLVLVVVPTDVAGGVPRR